MVYRVYVEKKPGLRHSADSLKEEIRAVLGIKELTDLRLFNRYDVEGIDKELFDYAVGTVFSEPQQDETYAELPAADAAVFAVEYLPGQYDQRADSAAQCIQIISQGNRPAVRNARVYMLFGNLTAEQIAEIRKYVINPVESREASLEMPETLDIKYDIPESVATLEGFTKLDEEGLKQFMKDFGLAMDLGD
ncbi:MAG: phosphoribosylformylglycinamidine synthase, partial [Oscillospiraceae bacterium]|nr:phosphoribosylformylglycinamidine synthase [Oscillospiraceae bacterium]